MQYFGADGLGSMRQLYDATGQVLANTRYDPYGNVMSQSGEATSIFGYTSEQHDAATGLEYLRARYYSPAQGRFVTRDPWEGTDDAPLSLNRWNYARGDPVDYGDPSAYGSCFELPTWRDIVDCLQRSVAKPIKKVNPLPPVPRQIVNDLLDVQFTGFLDTAGLEGDWLRLTRAWILNERPSDLGIWGTAANGDPLVTITAPGYVNDLKKKLQYAIVKNEFAAKYPDICSIRPGAFITDTFVFTGNGTAGREPFQDKYNALEWFLGSYDYLVRARDVDTSRSVVHIDVEVTNRSNWQSESRIPPSWQEKTIGLSVGGVTLIQPRNIPPYLIPDWVGQGGRPGAAFQERFIWQDSMQYPWVPIPVNPALPPPPVHFG